MIYRVRVSFAPGIAHLFEDIEAPDILAAFKAARKLHPKAIVVSDTAT